MIRVDDVSVSLEDIGSDDEIWLLQCPQSVSIMLGRTLIKKNYLQSSKPIFNF